MKTTKRILSVILTLLIIFATIPEFLIFTNAKSIKAKAFKNGDIIELGMYPQGLVKDESLIGELNAFNTQWVSYKYYSGSGDISDGNMSPKDFMKYKDVKINNEKYRGVCFSHYRPYWTGQELCTESETEVQVHLQSNYGYYINTVFIGLSMNL